MNCGKCGGATWDNTQKVQGGWNGPLFKCRDKSCDWVQWPPKGEKSTAPAKNGSAQSHGPKWTWAQLSALYRNSLLVARKHVTEALPNAAPTDVIAATATVFIAASRDGVAAPVKEQSATTQPLHEKPKQFTEESDDDLPF